MATTQELLGINEHTPPGFAYICQPHGCSQGEGPVMTILSEVESLMGVCPCLQLQLSGPTPTITATVYRPLAKR